MTDRRVIQVEDVGETGTTLLFRVKNKDPDGWQRLVHLYSPLIYRWCRQSGVQECDAADVGQEVFQAVDRTIETFHRDQAGDTFRGWLRRITQNKIRDRTRRPIPGGAGVGGDAETLTFVAAANAEDSSGSGASPGLGLGGEVDDEELLLMRRAVEMVLADYDDATRQAFFRVIVGEEEAAEVAQSLGMSVNSVYLAKSRIKRRIREEFAGLLESI